jgi:hypothetical protein
MPSPASLASSNRWRSNLSGDGLSTQFIHLPVTNAPSPSVTGTHYPLSTTHESIPFLDNSDSLLSIFRERLAAQIPFVVIPPHLTAKDLHRDKPMVYMTIMFATSYTDMATQQELGRLILKYLATNAILQGRKSLDTLQGLLMYIFWSVFS